MAAHAGEKARKTGDFVCKNCDEVVHVKKGEEIPECPCGGTEYEERKHEPENPSTSKKYKEEYSKK